MSAVTVAATRVVAVAAWKAVAAAILAALAGAALAWAYQTIGDRARAPLAADLARLRAAVELSNQTAADRATESRDREARSHAELLERLGASDARTGRLLGDLAASGPDFERRLRLAVAGAVANGLRRTGVPGAAPADGHPGGPAPGPVAGPDDRRVDTATRRLAALTERAALESARLMQCQADYQALREAMGAPPP